MVSAIIPAYNEEATIEEVIRAAEGCSKISEIIVVCDGCTDKTAEVARKTSAQVLELKENAGKAAAMEKAVALAKGDILVFLDADLHGLTPEIIRSFVQPVLAGSADMTIIARNYLFDHLNRFPRTAPGGERALRRSIWDMVPPEDRRGFQIELAMNYHALRAGLKILIIDAPIRHTYKVTKYGWRKGSIAEAKAFFQVANIFLRSYVSFPLKKMLTSKTPR